MRRATVPVVLTVAALALAACGGGSSGGSGLPTVGASPTSSAPATTTAPTSSAPAASATPATDPSPWTALPTIPNGPNKGLNLGAVLASSVARTPREQEAVQKFTDLWAYLAKIGYSTAIKQSELDAVGSGPVQRNAKAYVAGLRKKKAQTIGWVSINVTKVTVSGGSVFVEACIDNGSFDVERATGRRLEKTVPAYDAFAAVRTVDGRLVVTSSRSSNRTKACPQKAPS